MNGNPDIRTQIDFIKRERKILIEIAQKAEKNSTQYKTINEKIKFYEAIEQNMYALQVIASQFLKHKADSNETYP